MALFCVSFALWGPLVALFYGGFMGLCHALVCAIAMWAATQHTFWSMGPVLMLIPAWFFAGFVGRAVGIPGGDISSMIAAVCFWNVLMAGWTIFVAWVEPPRKNIGNTCPECGYSTAGLPSSVTICPECGTPIPPQNPEAAP